MLEEVKNYLRITWDDEDADIQGIITRGEAYLSRRMGTTLSFEENDLPKQLLLDYCRYVRNNSFELFEENFRDELMFLSLQEGVRDMREKDG